MWPDRVSNPGPLTNESGALPTALRGPAHLIGPCRTFVLKYTIGCRDCRLFKLYFSQGH